MNIGVLLVALLPLAFVIYWVTDVLNNISNGEWRALLKQAIAFAAAFIVISLFAHSEVNLGGGEGVANVSKAFAQLPWQAVALLSLVIAAGGGSFADYLRARNPADSTVKARLAEKFVPTRQDA